MDKTKKFFIFHKSHHPGNLRVVLFKVNKNSLWFVRGVELSPQCFHELESIVHLLNGFYQVSFEQLVSCVLLCNTADWRWLLCALSAIECICCFLS